MQFDISMGKSVFYHTFSTEHRVLDSRMVHADKLQVPVLGASSKGLLIKREHVLRAGSYL